MSTAPVPPTPHSLQIQLLGGFAVRRDEHTVTGFSYIKVRALLAYLLLEARPVHSREQLAELLWPEAAAGLGRNNLSHALHCLRRLFKEGELRLESEGKQLLRLGRCDALDLDVGRLRCDYGSTGPQAVRLLEEQVSLYRGTLLDGLLLPDTPAFDHWLALQQEACLQRVLTLHQRLTDFYKGQGQPADAVRHAERQFTLLPWHEPYCLQLMQLLLAQGQTGAALRIFERHCHCLQEEFGIGTTAPVQALASSLRSPAPAR